MSKRDLEDNGAKEIKRTRENATLHSMSVKWARMIQENKGKYSIQGWPVDHIRLFGKIVTVTDQSQDKAPLMLYTLLDSKGSETINVAVYLQEFRDKWFDLSQLQVGTYISCIGKLSKLASEKVILPKSIQVATDANEIFVHEAEIEYCNKLRESSMSSMSLMKFDSSKTEDGQFSAFVTDSAAPRPFLSATSNKKTPESEIKRAFAELEVTNPNGITLEQITAYLPEYSSETIQRKMDSMKDNNMIVPTIDKNHFMWC